MIIIFAVWWILGIVGVTAIEIYFHRRWGDSSIWKLLVSCLISLAGVSTFIAAIIFLSQDGRWKYLK